MASDPAFLVSWCKGSPFVGWSDKDIIGPAPSIDDGVPVYCTSSFCSYTLKIHTVISDKLAFFMVVVVPVGGTETDGKAS